MIAVRGIAHPLDLPEVLMICTCERGELRWDEKRAWRCDAVHSCGRAVPLSGMFDEQDLEYKLSLGFHPRNLELSVFAVHHLYAGLIWVSWLTRDEVERMAADIPDRTFRDKDRALLALVMRQPPRVEIGEWSLSSEASHDRR
jgi:hypothetical protein